MFATEAIPARDRLARVRQLGGNILTYANRHNIEGAHINFRSNTSFNTNAAVSAGRSGEVGLDVWAAAEYATKLQIDTKVFMEHLIKVFKATVITLTEGKITTFKIIK